MEITDEDIEKLLEEATERAPFLVARLEALIERMRRAERDAEGWQEEARWA